MSTATTNSTPEINLGVLQAEAEQFRDEFQKARAEIGQVIVGQDRVVETVLTALFCGGNVLLEGVPGLGKTELVKALSKVLSLEFSRIQFTPDLMPADIIGTNMMSTDEKGKYHFEFRRGPLFTQLLLADEINRASPKTQSALLETMQEGSVTTGGNVYHMTQPFFVMATQNPLEQEGTYPLPEAQLDRFLLHIQIDYPDAAAERRILELARREAAAPPTLPGGAHEPVVDQAQVFAARREVLGVYMSEAVERYLLELVFATRTPATYGSDLAGWLAYGGSPRATIALDRAARAHAWLRGEDFVSPADVQDVAGDVLRHRLILNYEAAADGITADRFVAELLGRVAVP